MNDIITTDRKISVIITTYNRKEKLKKAITSVLNQEYMNFELIIMDNASTDETNKYILTIKDKRIKYYRNSFNVGPGMNKRKGLEHVNGDVVTFLDDDDYYIDNKLFGKVISAFLQTNSATVIINSFIENKEKNIYIKSDVGFIGRLDSKEFSDGYLIKYNKPNSTFTTFQSADNLSPLYELNALDDSIIFSCALSQESLFAINDCSGVYTCGDYIGHYKVGREFFETNYYGLLHLMQTNAFSLKRWYKENLLTIVAMVASNKDCSFKDFVFYFKRILRSNSKNTISELGHLVYRYLTRHI